MLRFEPKIRVFTPLNWCTQEEAGVLRQRLAEAEAAADMEVISGLRASVTEAKEEASSIRGTWLSISFFV